MLFVVLLLLFVKVQRHSSHVRNAKKNYNFLGVWWLVRVGCLVLLSLVKLDNEHILYKSIKMYSPELLIVCCYLIKDLILVFN